MPTRAELNDGLLSVEGSVESLITEQGAAFARLEALILNGQDFSAEIARLAKLNADVQAAKAIAQAKGV